MRATAERRLARTFAQCKVQMDRLPLRSRSYSASSASSWRRTAFRPLRPFLASCLDRCWSRNSSTPRSRQTATSWPSSIGRSQAPSASPPSRFGSAWPSSAPGRFGLADKRRIGGSRQQSDCKTTSRSQKQAQCHTGGMPDAALVEGAEGHQRRRPGFCARAARRRPSPRRSSTSPQRRTGNIATTTPWIEESRRPHADRQGGRLAVSRRRWRCVNKESSLYAVARFGPHLR